MSPIESKCTTNPIDVQSCFPILMLIVLILIPVLCSKQIFVVGARLTVR